MLDLNQIYNIDALEGLKQLDENSIDAIVSDPPYQLTSTRVYGKETSISEISNQLKNNVEENTAYGSLIKGFMNKSWDVLPSVDILKECLRVLKTGGWALWLMTPRQDSQLEFMLRLRQAGFNISFSSIEWVYLSGFPKASNLSILADKRACKEDLTHKLNREPTKEEFKEAWSKWREKIAINPSSRPNEDRGNVNHLLWKAGKVAYETKPNSQESKALSGSYSGMQLKPARELIIVTQKPLAEKTYLDQALLHLKDPEHNQLGGTWLNDCKVPYKNETDRLALKRAISPNSTSVNGKGGAFSGTIYGNPTKGFKDNFDMVNGRFPANIIVSDNALDIGINNKSIASSPNTEISDSKNIYDFNGGKFYKSGVHYGDSGDLSRYFDLDFWFENKLKELPEEQQKIFPFLYVPKASKSEKNKGLDNLKDQMSLDAFTRFLSTSGDKRNNLMKNTHATVKPIRLMSYLITLTTRENDIVLDPFIGSGTTAISSILLKRRFIGFEREQEYYNIATERIKYYQKQEMI